MQGLHARLTLALQALVHEAVQQGAAVVAEGGTGVGVQAEPVLGVVILKLWETPVVGELEVVRMKSKYSIYWKYSLLLDILLYDCMSSFWFCSLFLQNWIRGSGDQGLRPG